MSSIFLRKNAQGLFDNIKPTINANFHKPYPATSNPFGGIKFAFWVLGSEFWERSKTNESQKTPLVRRLVPHSLGDGGSWSKAVSEGGRDAEEI